MKFSAYSKISVLICASVTLVGCVDPKYYETAPVKVTTELGVVTCQLYTKQSVTWDRAIDYPREMSVEAADAVCRAEGRRQKR